MASRLLFSRSGANLGIRMSWKPNVTVHLPCISILAPRTSHQASPSKSSARSDSHAATARTSVEFWQLACVCMCVCVSASSRCVRPRAPANADSYSDWVWPASRWERRGVLQVAAAAAAAAMSEAEACCCVPGPCEKILHKLTVFTHTHTHTQSLIIFSVFVALKSGTHVNTLHTGALRCMNIHLQL